MTCEQHREFFKLPMKEFDRKLDEYIKHGKSCPICSEEERRQEELANAAVVAFVTDVPLDDIPLSERPDKYVYISKEELFEPD